MKQNTKKTSRRLKTAWVRMRIDPDLKGYLQEVADEEDRNFSEIVRLLLEFGAEELKRAGSWVALKNSRADLRAWLKKREGKAQ